MPVLNGDPTTFQNTSNSNARLITRSNTGRDQPEKKLWVDYRRARWQSRIKKWHFAHAYYTAEVLDNPEAHIIRREQGETKDAWKERAAMADFGGHFASLVDKFNGMAESAQDDTTRIWQPEDQAEGFGDPEDSGSVAHRLMNDYDGQGTDLEAFWKQVRSLLAVLHEVWILADGPVTVDNESGGTDTVQESSFKMIMPWDVVNTFYSSGRLQAVLVKEQVDRRESIKDLPVTEEQFVLYLPDRWERYRIVEKTQDNRTKRSLQQIGEEEYGSGEFVDRNGQPIPPIYDVELPLRRFIGWMAAKKEQAIFNKESERDFAARMSCFNKLCPEESISDDIMEQEVRQLIEGTTVLQEPWKYINPSHEPVESNSSILQEKKETFYRVMFQKYEDEAKQATATSIRQNAFSGQDSFLNLLVGTEDEAEQMGMWLMGQIEFPQAGPEVWGGFSVNRSREFDPVDPDEMVQQMKDRYFGRSATVPVGEAGKIDVAKTIADQDGVNYDEDEIENEVRAADRREAQQQAAFEQIGGSA